MIELLASAGGTAAFTDPASPALFWAFILLGAAIGLLVLEVFVPSGGMLAIVAGVCLVGSMLGFFMHSTGAGFLALGVLIVFGPVATWLAFRLWMGSSLADRMILGAASDPLDRTSQEAYDESRREQVARSTHLQALIGSEGVSVTVLRPVGVVRIDRERYDALAETGLIAADRRIIVTEAYDNQLNVRPANTDA